MHLCTEFAEPFQVLSDEFLFAFQYLGNWDNTQLLLSYHLGLHIYHKSHSFAELVLLLHHYINLLRLLRADAQHFYLSFLSGRDRCGGAGRSVLLGAARVATAPPRLTERSGKFPHLPFDGIAFSKYCYHFPSLYVFLSSSQWFELNISRTERGILFFFY
uniref:Uncharacterized protein n=1 Tax=Neovison vison TaxID=452646 RepID=A0A8C7BEY2_NEOVI